jgi:hypothetical protein
MAVYHARWDDFGNIIVIRLAPLTLFPATRIKPLPPAQGPPPDGIPVVVARYFMTSDGKTMPYKQAIKQGLIECRIERNGEMKPLPAKRCNHMIDTSWHLVDSTARHRSITSVPEQVYNALSKMLQ